MNLQVNNPSGVCFEADWRRVVYVRRFLKSFFSSAFAAAESALRKAARMSMQSVCGTAAQS
jgi:hypothetical protein